MLALVVVPRCRWSWSKSPFSNCASSIPAKLVLGFEVVIVVVMVVSMPDVARNPGAPPEDAVVLGKTRPTDDADRGLTDPDRKPSPLLLLLLLLLLLWLWPLGGSCRLPTSLVTTEVCTCDEFWGTGGGGW